MVLKGKRREIYDLTGMTFGEYLVLHKIPAKWGQTHWLCKCSCGTLKEVNSKHLRYGKRVSCGCLNGKEQMWQVNHGLSNTTEYAAWKQMRIRCYDENDMHYPDYGARGITVCERWRKSFISFFEDMGLKPKGLSLDRIDNDGNYEPSNCRWATVKRQNRNKRTTNYVTMPITGEFIPLADAAERTGISYACLSKRYWKYKDDTEKLFAYVRPVIKKIKNI